MADIPVEVPVQPDVINFGDITERALRLLVASLGIVAPEEQTREALEAALLEFNNHFTPAADLQTTLTAPQLRRWATFCGVSPAGVRRTILNRIVQQGNEEENEANNANNPPPPPPDQADLRMDNPRELELSTIKDKLNEVELRKWKKEILSHAAIAGHTTLLETLFGDDQVAIGNLPPRTDRENQFLQRLKLAMDKSIAPNLACEIDPLTASGEIEDTPEGIYKWLFEELGALGTAMERKAEAKIDSMEWFQSKVALFTWVGQLREVARKLGPKCPAGFPRESKIRSIIMKNVGLNNPECAQLIREHKRYDCDNPLYTVNILVRDLTKIMCETAEGGEKQCKTFAVKLVSADAMLAAKENQIAQLKTENKKKKDKEDAEENVDSYYNDFRSNKGKGKNRQNKGGWNRQQNQTTFQPNNQQPRGTFCHKCHKHYQKTNELDAKWGAITSHYTSNCTWKNQGGKKGNGKGKGKGKQGVRKDNDKQKNKGQGKGKGKGGKKNQGFKGGRGTDPWA